MQLKQFLVRDGIITEGTHTNFFAVKNETVYTAPKSRLILEGITQKSCSGALRKIQN